jgi:hypothetical protein
LPSEASLRDRRFKGCTLIDKPELVAALDLKVARRVRARAGLGDHDHQRERLKTLFGETGGVRLFA